MRVITLDLIRNLRAITNELQPFTAAALPNSFSWDGTEYVKRDHHSGIADPLALAWWSRLDTLTNLLETQETELSTQQLSYLGRLLYGGAGFIDFALDADRWGPAATLANRRIDQKRTQLFKALNRLRFRWRVDDDVTRSEAS